MTRGIIFPSSDELRKKLPPGHSVVAIRLEDGSLELYDDPKNTTHSHGQHLLECNKAGAKVLYGEQVAVISSL